jgi:hypothetical protein
MTRACAAAARRRVGLRSFLRFGRWSSFVHFDLLGALSIFTQDAEQKDAGNAPGPTVWLEPNHAEPCG